MKKPTVKQYKEITYAVKGYKIFNFLRNGELMCRDYQFGHYWQIEGTKHNIRRVPIICKQGFHFCKIMVDCFKYYPHLAKSDNVVCEVKAYKKITTEKDTKYATNCLEIVRIIPWEEVWSNLHQFRKKEQEEKKRHLIKVVNSHHDDVWLHIGVKRNFHFDKKINERAKTKSKLFVKKVFHYPLRLTKTNFNSGLRVNFLSLLDYDLKKVNQKKIY